MLNKVQEYKQSLCDCKRFRIFCPCLIGLNLKKNPQNLFTATWTGSVWTLFSKREGLLHTLKSMWKWMLSSKPHVLFPQTESQWGTFLNALHKMSPTLLQSLFSCAQSLQCLPFRPCVCWGRGDRAVTTLVKSGGGQAGHFQKVNDWQRINGEEEDKDK